MITLELTDREAHDLFNSLSGLIAKSSLSTAPSWAKRVMFKIQKACAAQIPSDVTKRDPCNDDGCINCAGVCPHAYEKS